MLEAVLQALQDVGAQTAPRAPAEGVEDQEALQGVAALGRLPHLIYVMEVETCSRLTSRGRSEELIV